MRPKISIICPVYKVEKFLCKCIDSIIGQTFTEWELVLVDDGSPDNSGKICDEYSAKDNRIRAIHKRNAGVSAARQTGLDASNGEYVIHVDPDDWVEPTMLEELYDKAISEGVDVVLCDYYVNKDIEQIYIKQKPTSLSPSKILRDLFQQLHGSCWNKLVKRVCYSNYSINFPIGLNYCEDIITWIQFYQHEDVKTAYLPKAYYHYHIHDSSITNSFTRKTYEMRKKYITLLKEYLPNNGFEFEIRKAQLQVLFEACMNNVLTAKEAQQEVWLNKRAAFCENHNIKWLFGYLLILIGFYSIGHRWLKY